MLNNKHPIASLRQLVMVSMPLVLTGLSLHTMFLVDRIVVSNYDVGALGPVTMAGNMCGILEIGAVVLASISEVFVGQYNGARKTNLIASPVWQMLWFAFALFLLTIPMSIYGGSFFLNEEFMKYGDPYYRTCILFAPLGPMIAALSAFYIGRGKVLLTTSIVIFGNALNILLDVVMVFGWKAIPSFGPVGAAYATVISSGMQVLVLFSVFMSKKNIKKYKTNIASFNAELFKKCVKIGFPNALGISVEMFGWFSVLLIVSHLGKGYIEIHSMTQNILLVFMFFSDGVSKGVSVIASNMIGANKLHIMNRLLSSGMKLHITYIALLSIPCVIYPEFILKMFFGDLSGYSQYFIDQSIKALRYCWIALLFDGLFWIGAGVLIAGGDTLFLTVVNALTIWIFSVVPIIIVVKFYDVAPSTLWLIMSIYKVISFLATILRYKSKKWLKLVL